MEFINGNTNNLLTPMSLRYHYLSTEIMITNDNQRYKNMAIL